MRSRFQALTLAVTVGLGGLGASAVHAAPIDLRARARALLEDDKPADAVMLLEEATKMSPQDPESWAELGNARLALSQFGPAAQAFEQAVRLAPDLSTAQYNFAYALRKAGNLPRAAEAYRVYLTRYSDDADAHFGLAETLRALDDRIAAAEAYERYAAAEKRPDRAAWVTKAQGWARELRSGEVKATTGATPHLSFAANDRPDVPPPMEAAPPPRAGPHVPALAIGLGLIGQGKFAEALVELRRAEPSDDPWVHAAIGSALLGTEEVTEANNYYLRALSGVPVAAQAAVRLGLAECARKRGDRIHADSEYRAILVDTSASPALLKLAKERLEE